MSDGQIISTVLGLSVGGLLLFFGAVAWVDYLYESNIQCPAFARNVERPYRYDWFAGGCFVQTQTGQWVAEKNYWNNPVVSQ